MSIRPGSALLLILLALGGYVMLADFFNLRQVGSGDAPELSGAAMPWPQPWGGYGQRELVMAAGDDWMIDSETTSKLIAGASPRYPLDARQWLDRARISVGEGNFDQVDLLLDKAIAIRPLHRPTLWSAAQIALQTGDAGLAERQLRQWLQLYPGDTGQALFIGRRWISEPGELVDRMLPPRREYLEEAMQVALRQNDFSLADEVWKRLEPKPALDDATFLQYVELLLDTGQVAHAAELWADRDPTWRPGMLVNGDFARELGESLGLNWRTRFATPGVVIERDLDQSYSSPASLKIAFNGKENVRLTRPWIRIPVTPGGRYRLSGVWRAEGLTTRALPYLQLSAEGSRFSERVEVRDSEFDWRPWSLEFDVPEDSQLMRLALRRDSTRAFDRNIDGELWLDEFRLEPIVAPEPEKSLQSVAAEALGRDASVKGTGSGFRVPVSAENPPAEEPATGVGAGDRSDGAQPASDSLARQAPTTVDGSDPTGDYKPASVLSTGVGAGLAGDAAQRDSGSLAGQAPTLVAVSGRDSVGAGSGRDQSAPEPPPTKHTTNNQPSATPLTFRKPEPGNRTPGPEAP